MTIAVDLRCRQGDFMLDAAFESDGRLVALFGPSGSGKSTLINLIGGLLRPDGGRVTVDGLALVDTASGAYVPAHRRRIGYVFQDARLFPHMSVANNLRYGRLFAPRRERYADWDHVVELLGIGHLLERRPSGLSGGEKQRVAIGRALLASPRLILMDEPLASLDEARKAEIMPYIERLRDDTRIPIVYVSHSVAEVARLASDVVVLAQGRVAAHGPARDILSRLDLLPQEERDEGGSLIELELAGHDEEFGLSVLRSPAGEWRLPRVKAEPGARVRVRVRARDVMIATTPLTGVSALNALQGRIAEIRESEGAEALVDIDCGGDIIVARVTRLSVHALGLAPGLPVQAVVKSVTFDRTGGAWSMGG